MTFCRAENETRTRDPDLGKVVLYQLSYFRIRDCKYMYILVPDNIFLNIFRLQPI